MITVVAVYLTAHYSKQAIILKHFRATSWTDGVGNCGYMISIILEI